MNREVKLVQRDVYGKPTLYPVNRAAQLFALIAGTRTIRHNDVEMIRQLGFDVVISGGVELQVLWGDDEARQEAMDTTSLVISARAALDKVSP